MPKARKEEEEGKICLGQNSELERARWGDMWNRCKGWLLLVPMVNRRAAHTGMKSAGFVLGQVPKIPLLSSQPDLTL